MRLVDAELFDFISFQAAGDTAYDQGFEDGVQFVAEKIDAAPTISAIPVEWFKNRRDIYLKAYHAGHESELHVAAILNDTLKAWQKEQEAR